MSYNISFLKRKALNNKNESDLILNHPNRLN